MKANNLKIFLRICSRRSLNSQVFFSSYYTHIHTQTHTDMDRQRNNTKFVEVLILQSCSTNWGCHIVTIDDNRSTVVTLVAGLRPTPTPIPSPPPPAPTVSLLYIQPTYIQTAHATHLRHRFVIKIVIAHNGFISLALSRYVFVSFLALSLYLHSTSFSFLFRLALGNGREGDRVTTATPTLGRRATQRRRKTNLVFRLPQRNKFNNIFGFPPFCFLFYYFFCFVVHSKCF